MANANMGFTPGVYIQEQNAFGNSVVPAPTAVPAFIGYTQYTSYKNQDISFQFMPINSWADFIAFFGPNPPQVQFEPTPQIVMPAAITGAAAASKKAADGLADGTLKTALVKANTDIAAATTPALATAQIELVTKSLNAEIDADKVVPGNVTAATLVLNYANYQFLAVSTESGFKTNSLGATAATDVAAIKDEADKKKFTGYLTALQTATSQKSVNATLALVGAEGDTNKDAKAALIAYGNALDSALGVTDYWANSVAYNVSNTTVNYRMYAAIQFFYNNGGGSAYVCSVGQYTEDSTLSVTKPFTDAIDLLKKETDPTMLLIPDAVEFSKADKDTLEERYGDCYTLQSAMLNHCGLTMNKIAVLDIPGAWQEIPGSETTIDAFRNKVAPTDQGSFSYGSAYYPWLNTNVYQPNQIGGVNVDTTDATTYANVFAMLTIEQIALGAGVISPKMVPYIDAFAVGDPSQTAAATDTYIQINPAMKKPLMSASDASAALFTSSPSYQLFQNTILAKLNLMPPAAAMAGIYTAIDSSEGVWFAPANVGVQSVYSPSINVSDDDQHDINVPIDGKSVCAIRSFPGRGTLVWGARTLDGNSDDWRYINVRRTMMFIEKSVKEAAFTYVFAPNVAGTWIDVQSMITNFLTGLWSQGGLAGSKPEGAFSVAVGLGSTMTSQDILNGIMRVKVKVAISHPAEFIEITFQQQMQS